MAEVEYRLINCLILAAVTCRKGEEENDTQFLRSDWYHFLKGTVLDFIKEHRESRSSGNRRI